MNQESITKVGVYSLKGNKNESTVNIVGLGVMELKGDENVRDTCINRFEISKNISGIVFACNITHAYLISTKKLPVIYVSVVYEQGLKCYRLMDIYVTFTITSEIKSAKQLLSEKLNGFFDVEAVIDGEAIQLDEKIDKFQGETELIEQLSKFITTDEMKEMINELLEVQFEKQRQKFNEQYHGVRIPEKIISLKDYLDDD